MLKMLNWNKLKQILKHVIYPTVSDDLLDADTKFFINPTGRFVIGGPQGMQD